MSPSVLIELDGRRLDARSDGAFIPAGAAVAVLRGDPTGYVVRAVGPDNPLPALPNAGAEIARPEFMRNSAEVRAAAARDEAELRRRWRAATGAWLLATGALGATVGAGDALLAGASQPELFLAGAVGLLTGALLAFLVGRAGRFLRWSPVAGLFAVFGGLAGAEAGFWAHVATGTNLPAVLAAGAIIGTVVGGWVGRNIDVLGGPDVGG
ncbi:hypothetical protein J0H58_22785 [bacterium]|nr:hypothetical protein [bacterium]